MASKVLVPTVPFGKLQQVKTTPDTGGSGFLIEPADTAGRVAHLEHSVRFLQEQHRLMLNGLHAEIEALRERNRDLHFQLIFNKESSAKASPTAEEKADSLELIRLKQEVTSLEGEAASSRGEARAAEARALQLQNLIDSQAEKLRELELKTSSADAKEVDDAGSESRAELRARLSEAEHLVRRLRREARSAERRRSELQCMKNSLHASLRATGLDPPFGYQNTYHFPPLPAHDFWREPLREEFMVGMSSRNSRRPLTLPHLAAHSQQMSRSTVYANHHTRPRPNGYDHKNKKRQTRNGNTANLKIVPTPEESPACHSLPMDPIPKGPLPSRHPNRKHTSDKT